MKYKDSLEENMHHFRALNALMEKFGWPTGGGSYLIDGQSLDYNPVSFAKQELLFNSVNALLPHSSVLEVGVYSGHSAFIMLMASPIVTIVGIDVCFPFTEPCVDYLNEHFSARMTLFKGDSDVILSPSTTFNISNPDIFDLVHVDGNHDVEHIKRDVEHIRPLLKKGGAIVLDDFDGIRGTMMDWIDERLVVVDVADCPNPNAICKYK